MKELKEAITCNICERTFKRQSFGNHLTVKHPEINVVEYYQQNINPNADGKCKFCGGPAQFLGVTRGFRNNCKDPICVKKSQSPFSLEYKTKVDGMLESEYPEYKKKHFEGLKSKSKSALSKKIENDPLFYNKNSFYCKEYWINKGYSENEAIELANIKSEDNRRKLKSILANDPNYMKGHTWVSKEYWINKGYTEDEAIKIVSEKQKTFSLDICITKYGETEGRKKWEQRQKKWMDTLDSKSDEEKLEILRKKVFFNKVYSEISQKLFFEILDSDNTINKEKIYFAKHNGEKELCINNTFIKPDLYYNGKIIEFFGNYWHANPKFYEPDKKIRRGSKNYTAESIIKIDRWRNSLIEKNGYNLLIIWEDEYKLNRNKVISECVNFLNS